MIDNFIAVSGNKVAFLSDLIRTNGLRIKCPVDKLYTEHGFLFPTSGNSLNLIAYLGGDKSIECSDEGVIKGVLLRHDGTMEEWIRGQDHGRQNPRMVKRCMPWGEGVVFLRSNNLTLEEQMVAMMDIHNDDLNKSMEMLLTHVRHGPSTIHIMDIPTILLELNKRFPQKKAKGK